MAVRFDAENEHYAGTTGLPGTTLTVTFWAYLSVDRDYYSTFISIDSDTAYLQLATDVDGVTPMAFNSVVGTVAGTSALTVGTWYAMAFVLDNTTGDGTLYWGTDPASLNSATSASGGFTPTHFRIGSYRSGGEWLNGRIAAVKLWNAALTGPQVTAELQSYEPQVTTDLIRVHKLQVPETVDYSGNGHTLTGGTGATAEDGPPISATPSAEPGRFFLTNRSAESAAEDSIVFINRPTQPMRYHYDGQPLAAWSHPGALVIAGLGREDLGPPGIDPAYDGTDPGYIAAAEAGATVIAYIDPIIDNDWGLYHELLLHEFDSLGRTVGPEAALWPGNHQANQWGNLIDFRPGSVIQQKFGAVLELMLEENPWLAGFWIDDTGTRSFFPDFDWVNDFSAQDRQDYRDGAIALVHTARQVCDAKRMANGRRRIVIVNGTWNGGTLLDNGGGYPNMAQHGCSLVEGAEIEHHTLDQFWIDYSTSPQWATEASTNGIPFMVASCTTDAVLADFRAADIVSHAESAESPTTVWGAFHETGLPDDRAGQAVQPLLVDTFDRPDTVSSLGTAVTGQAWTNASSTWQVLDRVARNTSAGTNGTALISCGAVDLDVTVTITYNGGSSPSLIFRSLDDSNRLSAVLEANRFALWHSPLAGGSSSYISGSGYNGFLRQAGVPYVVRVVAVGSNVTAYLDGVERINFDLDVDDTAKFTDLSYTNVGLRGQSGSTFNNLIVYAAA